MATTFDKGHAVVIGISDYAGANKLPATVAKDARDVADLLCSQAYCGFPPTQVRLLLNGAATANSIRAALLDLSTATSPEDTAVVYFSGHGAHVTSGPVAGNYLVPFDFDFARLAETAIESAELTTSLRAIPAKRIVVMLDACHSGGTGDPKGLAASEMMKAGLDEKAYERLAEGSGRVIFASCRSDEVSYVVSGMQNSLFTHYLLSALRGDGQVRNDGVVRVLDVFHHISAELPKEEPRQHPILKAHDVDNNFPVALFKGGIKTLDSSPGGAQVDVSKAIWNELADMMSNLYPKGPTDGEIWSRAGGNLALLDLNQNGHAAWFAALSKLRRGGGGGGITLSTLLNEVAREFPNHVVLNRIILESTSAR